MNFSLPEIRFIRVLLLLGALINLVVSNIVSAQDLIIDDRKSGNLSANLGTQWRLVTDQVMGGVSKGELNLDDYKGRNCLCMRGNVSTDNNGGFVQIALDLSQGEPLNASAYTGVELSVAGNTNPTMSTFAQLIFGCRGNHTASVFRLRLSGKQFAFLLQI